MPEFESSAERIDLEKGSIELAGTTGSGKSYVLSGDVAEVVIVSERRPQPLSSFGSYDSIPYSENNEYWLKLKIKKEATTGSYAYKIQFETVDVERTARILATDRTAKAIEAARVLAGAPESARISFSPRWGAGEALSLDEPQPVEINFYWTEKVVN